MLHVLLAICSEALRPRFEHASRLLLSRRGQQQRSRQFRSPGIVGTYLDVSAVVSRILAGRPGYRPRLFSLRIRPAVGVHENLRHLRVFSAVDKKGRCF